MNAPQPPGWYFDPTGRHEARWWSGSSWTEHVSDHGTTTSDPFRPEDVQPRAQQKKQRKGAPVALISVIVVLLLVAGGAAVYWFVVRDDDSSSERDLVADQALATAALVDATGLGTPWAEAEAQVSLDLATPGCEHLVALDVEPGAASTVGIGGFFVVEHRAVALADEASAASLLSALEGPETQECLLAVFGGENARQVTAPTAGDEAIAWNVETADGAVDVLALRTDRILGLLIFTGTEDPASVVQTVSLEVAQRATGALADPQGGEVETESDDAESDDAEPEPEGTSEGDAPSTESSGS